MDLPESDILPSRTTARIVQTRASPLLWNLDIACHSVRRRIKFLSGCHRLAMSNDSGERLDIWSGPTRFFKSQSLAKRAIEGGKIALNETAAKLARLIHVDDLLRIMRGIERFRSATSRRAPLTGGQPWRKICMKNQLEVSRRVRAKARCAG